MSGVLSQSQIDKLLSGLAAGNDEAEVKSSSDKDKVKAYDFKSPKKFTKEQLKTQESLYENFARILSSYFTSLLRVFCEIEVAQIEEQRFFEYNNALPDNGILSTYELQAKNNKIEEVPIIFNMSNSICFYLIDKLLGGPGTGWNYNRDFTDIEVAIVENILKKVETPLQECWSKYIELDCSLQAIETNPRLVQICAPEDIVLIVLLEVKMKEMSGTISICAPAINLVELMESFTSKFMRFSKRQMQDPQVKRNAIFSTIKKTDLELTAVLDEIEIDLYDLMQMQIGDIIPLNKKTDSTIVLKVDNKPWFNAKLGETKMKKAVKVTSVIEKGVDKEMSSIFTNDEIDVIGEIMNISMGSAATAVSTMLDKQVLITTPKVRIEKISNIDYSFLEPAMVVKITYIEGIDGANIMVFRQNDMQMIINQLMGNSMPISNDFVFDEFSISAACEVMNQMMGSSATALSQFLGKKVDISTPEASLFGDDTTFSSLMGMQAEDEIVAITFDLDIKDIMNSEFISVMPMDLAKMLVSQFMNGGKDPVNDGVEKVVAPQPVPAPAPTPAPKPAPQPSVVPQSAPQPQMVQSAPQPQPQMQYQLPPREAAPVQNVKVQEVEFPTYNTSERGGGIPLMNNNLDLIMNVPLNVSIEVGKTKKKIKDIMDFSQGTVLELEKQAGAPVDIIVNGQLIARGDVVVIDDNFAVRVTGIVNREELMETVIGKK